MERRFSDICAARKEAFEFLRNEERLGLAHLEHVLYFDDAALQDGGTHGWDLDGATVPRLPASGAHKISAQCTHHRALLLHGAAGDERLCLNDVGFGHHRSGGRVVKLRKDRYHLACREEMCVRNSGHFENGLQRLCFQELDSHLVCSLCGRSLRLQTPVQSFCTTPAPSCP